MPTPNWESFDSSLIFLIRLHTFNVFLHSLVFLAVWCPHCISLITCFKHLNHAPFFMIKRFNVDKYWYWISICYNQLRYTCCFVIRCVDASISVTVTMPSYGCQGVSITGNSTVCPTVCPGWHQCKHHSSTPLALCEGKPPVTDGFPSQRASNAEGVSMPWRHLDKTSGNPSIERFGAHVRRQNFQVF